MSRADCPPLCDHCCNSASEMCAHSCAQGPVVECSKHGVVIIGEDLDGWSPAPAPAPRAPLPDFAVSDPAGDVERARAEVEWLRTAARELIEDWERKAKALGRWESPRTTAMRYGFTACVRGLRALLDASHR